MRIAIGSDEATALTNTVLEDLRRRGHEPIPFGPLAGAQATWPVVARQVAEAVAAGQAEEGVLFCWTGTGVSIAANKVAGIRAALCDDAEIARGARLWNRANVLCLSLRSITEAVAREILDAWFATHYQPNAEDDACLGSLEQIERDHRRRA